MFEVNIDCHIPYMAELYHEPNIESENWKIRTFEITRNDWHEMISNGILPGKYVSLNAKNPSDKNMLHNTCMMSDTPMERFTNQQFINEAFGNVLIAGLGIGMVPAALADKDDVKSITVIEIDTEIISLVEPLIRKYIPNQHKIKIIQADAYEFPKIHAEMKYDFLWLDIWPEFPNTEDDYNMFEDLFSLYEPIMTLPRFNGWGYEYASCAGYGIEEINPIETDAFAEYLDEFRVEKWLYDGHRIKETTVDNRKIAL